MTFSLKRRSGEGVRTTTHPLAFCLVKYQNKVTTRVEWVWNAHTGDAPFLISDHMISDSYLENHRAKIAQGLIDPNTPDPLKMAITDQAEAVPIPNFTPWIGARVILPFGTLPKIKQATIQQLLGARTALASDHPICLPVDDQMAHEYSHLAASNPYEVVKTAIMSSPANFLH